MSDQVFKHYAALFFTSLGAFLGAIFLAHFVLEMIPCKPVIISYGPFEIDQQTKVVKPGGIVCYRIHYFKRLDIPGDINKTIVIQPDGGGDEIYVPLDDTAGHLPVGEVKKRACVRIPDWVPYGKGKIKLSASYSMGKYPPSRDIAWTKEFEVRP